ncbi:hypothetical protein FRB93_003878 [Tulasnella sp. JGI-2019a]|nr:hypothetical protein FRB93_003878 [Tulasnella sp. JGI-2019a]
MVLRKGDIIEMAHAWPHLRHLHITPDPIDEIAPSIGTSIALFTTIAELFPRTLEDLGIYLRLMDDEVLDRQGIVTLPRLQTLAVGTSPVTKLVVSTRAAFLAGICPPGVTIEAKIHSTGLIFGHPDLEQKRAAVKEVWKEIGDNVREIHDFQRPFRYQLEIAKAETVRARLR